MKEGQASAQWQEQLLQKREKKPRPHFVLAFDKRALVINSYSFVGHSEVQDVWQLLPYVETFPQTSVYSSNLPLHEELCWGG